LEENFLHVLRDYTAGDPMRDDVRWTNLTLAEIAQRLKDAGTPVSVTVVKQLLRKHRYVQRKAQKSHTDPGKFMPSSSHTQHGRYP
jgi:hypothetical protein